MRGTNKYRPYWERRDLAKKRLNSEGQLYRRTPNFKTPEEKLLARRARGLWAWHNRSARLARLGLTTRGTPRKRRYFDPESRMNHPDRLRVEARERMRRLHERRRQKTGWQQFRETVPVGLVSIEDISQARWELEKV